MANNHTAEQISPDQQALFRTCLWMPISPLNPKLPQLLWSHCCLWVFLTRHLLLQIHF